MFEIMYAFTYWPWVIYNVLQVTKVTKDSSQKIMVPNFCVLGNIFRLNALMFFDFIKHSLDCSKYLNSLIFLFIISYYTLIMYTVDINIKGKKKYI